MGTTAFLALLFVSITSCAGQDLSATCPAAPQIQCSAQSPDMQQGQISNATATKAATPSTSHHAANAAQISLGRNWHVQQQAQQQQRLWLQQQDQQHHQRQKQQQVWVAQDAAPQTTGAPVESPEQQQLITRMILAMLEQTSSKSIGPTLPPDVGPTQAWDKDNSTGSFQLLYASNRSQQQLIPLEGTQIAYRGPRSQVSRSLTFLNNSQLSVGIDLQRAGAISWVSSPHVPQPWNDKNLINSWDQGRLVQQSYYGCPDGSCWASRPWLYNPVQGGSWQNMPSVTTHFNMTGRRRLYAEGHPRNWGSQNLIKEVLLTLDMKLKRSHIEVAFSIRYSGPVTHPYMTQEVPAVFVDRRFSVLAYYAGSKPWTNDNNITLAFPGAKNIYAKPTEYWAAYIDPISGCGIGVFNPKAWLGLTAYRVGPDRSDKPWDTSYFAHTIRMQLHPGMQPYTYTSYITVGTLSHIRSTFARIAGRLRGAEDSNAAGAGSVTAQQLIPARAAAASYAEATEMPREIKVAPLYGVQIT